MQVLKQVSTNGDKVDWPAFEVCGDQFQKCFNAKVTLTLPDGVSLVGPSDPNSSIIKVPEGYYNVSEDIWYVGDVDAGYCTDSISFEIQVDDISQADPVDNRFIVTAVLTSSCVETSTSDNSQVLVIEVKDACENIDLSIGENLESGSTDLSIG